MAKMIIYRGRGFLVAVIAFGMLLLTELFTRAHFRDDTYFQRHGWPRLAGFLMAAAIVWLLIGQSEEVVGVEMEKQPKRRSIFRPQDSLFFIPVLFWPPVLLVLGVIFYFVRG
jgi:hypothetical protein